MRNSIFTGLLALVVGLSSLSFISADAVPGKDASSIKWVAKKVTGKHEGTVAFKSIDWKFDEAGSLVSANFTVDMTSIIVTDLEGKSKGDLEGHLNSADFFNTADYPSANFKTTSVTSKGKGAYGIDGELTIKGISKPLSFNATVNNDGHMKHANATVVIDRTNYDIKYGSESFFKGLGDKAINNEFTLEIEIHKH